MILFVSPYQNATECATQIARVTREEIKTVGSIRLAIAALRNHEFTAVVADENILECTPGGAEALLERIQWATPIFLDMACMRAERVAKFVELAIRRRAQEYKTTRDHALAELRSELKSEVTGLLITSELALKSPSVSWPMTEKLSTVFESAKRIRAKLEK